MNLIEQSVAFTVGVAIFSAVIVSSVMLSNWLGLGLAVIGLTAIIWALPALPHADHEPRRFEQAGQLVNTGLVLVAIAALVVVGAWAFDWTIAPRW